MKNSKQNKGITLITLVITIIVLLILAGISIATLTGKNGILTKADTAKKQSETADAIEQAKLDITTYMSDQIEQGKSTKLNDSIIQGILTGKDYVSKEESQPGEHSFKTYNGGHEIPYSELYVQKKVRITLSHSSFSVVSGTYILDEDATWSELIEVVNPVGIAAYGWSAFRLGSRDDYEGKLVTAPYDGGMAYPYYDFIVGADGTYVLSETVVKSRCLYVWSLV